MLRLEHGASLVGRVVVPAHGRSREALAVDLLDEYGVIESIRVEEGGRYRLEGLLEGRYRVCLRGKMAPVLVTLAPPRETILDLVPLESGDPWIDVSLSQMPEGVTLEYARAVWGAEDERAKMAETYPGLAKTEHGYEDPGAVRRAEGTWLGGLPTGPVGLLLRVRTIGGETFTSWTIRREVEVVAGANAFLYAWPNPSGSLCGSLPIEAQQLRVIVENEHLRILHEPRRQAPAFHIDGLPPGTYRVGLEGRPAPRTVSLGAGGTAAVSLRD